MSEIKDGIVLKTSCIGRKYDPATVFRCGSCEASPELKLLTGSGGNWHEPVLICLDCKSTYTFDDDQTIINGKPMPKHTTLIEVWDKEGPHTI